MRMWNVPPELMCDKHLIAEHVEMHMFEGSFRAGKKVAGYIRLGLLDCGYIKSRHDLLAEEMLRRGKKHVTLMPVNPTELNDKSVDTTFNIVELGRRCGACRIGLMKEYASLLLHHGILASNGEDKYHRQADGSYNVYFGGVMKGNFLTRAKAEKAMEDLRKGFAAEYASRVD